MQKLLLIPVLVALAVVLSYGPAGFAFEDETMSEFEDDIAYDEYSDELGEYADINDYEFVGDDYEDQYYEDEYVDEDEENAYYNELFEEYETDEYELDYVIDGRCSSYTITNDPSMYPRCSIIDTVAPKVGRVFVTPNDHVCVETHDNMGVARVTYNGEHVRKWPGSYGTFCSDEKFPPAMRIVAEDVVGNTVEKFATNRQKLLEAIQDPVFSAKRSLSLNPHHGMEGVNLNAEEPIKQIRLAVTGLMFNELRLSDYALQEVMGKKTVVVDYTGQYANTDYGKERHGQIHVFSANVGRLATFDVDVSDDIVVQLHEEKKAHKPYDLVVRDVNILDNFNLNAWQKAELERVFTSTDDLTMLQKNIVHKLL